ncbi:MAG TPA: O-antigen ligase family protein [Sphingomicrobium sp.]|nr:O-antigen ligase family protein [Sphingomicrobium sp.]
MSALLPASGLLLLLLFLGLRIARSASARFVVFACWLRFMLSTFHVYTFDEVVGTMSLTALGSASLFLLGLLLLPKAMLFGRGVMAVYLVIAAIFLSALANGALLAAFEPVTKFGLFLMIALHSYRALKVGDERQFGLALLLSFSPLIVFQLLSLAFDVPKMTEGTGGESYIGGYYHEAAFSIGVMALLVMVAIERSLPAALKLLILPLGLASILLANYRTAILATAPLMIYYLLVGITRPIDPRLRGSVAALAGIGIIVAVAVSVMTLERFSDLRTIAQGETSIIKPPNEFTEADANVLSGRGQIWSEYVYKWLDGSELRQLVGYGPESWEEYFPVYAHNSFISYLFEYGLVGLAALIFLFAAGVAMSLKARSNRWKLLAAHLSFLVVNLATMPFWLIEGNIVYGLIWGYTLFYCAERRPASAQAGLRPYFKEVEV